MTGFKGVVIISHHDPSMRVRPATPFRNFQGLLVSFYALIKERSQIVSDMKHLH